MGWQIDLAEVLQDKKLSFLYSLFDLINFMISTNDFHKLPHLFSHSCIVHFCVISTVCFYLLVLVEF